MSEWFDILYSRGEAARPEQTPAPAEVPIQAQAVIGSIGVATEGQDAKGSNQKNRGAIKPAPQLTGIPSRWTLEVQKIVFHLQPKTGRSSAPRNMVFSGVQNGSGTTTICYLVAHHLATEGYDKRVLYVDFSGNRKSAPKEGAEEKYEIGREFTESLFGSVDKALTRVSIRPGEGHSVASASGWLREFVRVAKESFDFVLIDVPPFYAAPEAYSIAKACDGVVLVLKSGETRYPALNALVTDLELLGIEVIGAVLNFRQYPIPRWLLKYI